MTPEHLFVYKSRLLFTRKSARKFLVVDKIACNVSHRSCEVDFEFDTGYDYREIERGKNLEKKEATRLN